MSTVLLVLLSIPLSVVCIHTPPQVITNIDVQSIEPVDQQMRDSLSKSVQMAIEISTKSATIHTPFIQVTYKC